MYKGREKTRTMETGAIETKERDVRVKYERRTRAHKDVGDCWRN